jgi:hypothetical protein
MADLLALIAIALTVTPDAILLVSVIFDWVMQNRRS